jgi:hypothetical protein
MIYVQRNYTFNVELKDIEITPDLEEHFKFFGKKVRTIAPIGELVGILPDEVIRQFNQDKKVLVECDYETGVMDVDILEDN